MIVPELSAIQSEKKPLATATAVFLIHSHPARKDDGFSELKAAIKLRTITPSNRELLRLAEKSAPPIWLTDDESSEY